MPEAIPSPAPSFGGSPGNSAAARPFLGLIDAIIVPDPVDFPSDGAISFAQANAAWIWMQRDVAPDLIGPERLASGGEGGRALLEASLPELFARLREIMKEMDRDAEYDRRIRVQMGGDEPAARLPLVLSGLRNRGLLVRAQEFGRAANNMADDSGLAVALRAMPLSDAGLSAMLMQAAVGQVASPSRLVVAAVKIAGAPTEPAVQRAGLRPLIDAVLSHAQAQLAPLKQTGIYADVDLICHAIVRFHRLIRAVTGYLELMRLSPWSIEVSELIKAASGLLEPRLREVVPDISRALRVRDGVARVDEDQLLIALNGCYVAAAIRDARDSLALNALFDQTWAQLGQALETYLERNMDALRRHPGDRATARRLDVAIKMAELRFNADYAATLRRARDTAERRIG